MKTITENLKFADEYPNEAGKIAQRLHRKKDDIPFVRKYFTYDKQEGDVNKKDRTVVSRISCVSKDRDGESLLPDGVQLENYRQNPIVCWGHSYGDPKNFVGKNLWIKKDDKGLIAKTVFAKTEFADQVFRAYTEDVGNTGPLLKGFSVGFIPLSWDDPEPEKGEDAKDLPKRTYTEWELLEYSCVGIPCSPESLTMAYEKGMVSKNFKERIEKDITLDDDNDKHEPDTGLVDDTIDSDDLEDKNADIVLKPETTDDYHRIPVSEGHDDHEIRTIDVSESEEIKALYCVDCKEIITYMFSTSAWSMNEAQAWVDEHKEITMEDTDTKTIITVDNIMQEIDGEIDELGLDPKEVREELTEQVADEAKTEIEDEPKSGWESKVLEALEEFKEGRVLSSTNRKLVKNIIDGLDELRDNLSKLYEATEPPIRESASEEITVEGDFETTKSQPQLELPDNLEEIISEAVEKSLTPERIGKVLREKVKDEIDRLKGVVR